MGLYDTIVHNVNKSWYKHKTYIIIVGLLLFCLLVFYVADNKFFQNINDILVGKANLRGDVDIGSRYYIGKKKRDPKKTENMCRSILEDITELPFPSRRPDFLNNPKTGRNLECDMMNDDVKICVETNGKQHYKKDSHFHTKSTSYDAQRERDTLKKKLLEKNGYTLIEIPYTVHSDTFGQYLCTHLPSYVVNQEKCDKYLSQSLYD